MERFEKVRQAFVYSGRRRIGICPGKRENAVLSIYTKQKELCDLMTRGAYLGRLMDRAKDKIHTRTIRMSTFAVDETHILSTGHFQDVRHFPSSDCAGRSYCAGTLHDLDIHVLLKTPEMVIEDIEVFVNTVPRQDCTTLTRSLDSVIGLSIARGFTNKVKELSGGTRGWGGIRGAYGAGGKSEPMKERAAPLARHRFGVRCVFDACGRPPAVLRPCLTRAPLPSTLASDCFFA